MKASILNKNGKPMANQIILSTDTATELQSYDTLVVRKETISTITLDPAWTISKTTTKAVCAFLGDESRKDVEVKIKAGVYVVGSLNKSDDDV